MRHGTPFSFALSVLIIVMAFTLDNPWMTAAQVALGIVRLCFLDLPRALEVK